MNRFELKTLQRIRRAHRVRARFTGTALRPRLSVRVTNKHVIAQVIDDTAGCTLAYVTSAKLANTEKLTLVQKAELVGAEIAKLAKKAKIDAVVFDRGSKLYHGRIKAVAEAAKTAGLEL